MNPLRNAAPIPLDWTASESLAVATFLQEVLDSIWLVHGDTLDRALAAKDQLDLFNPPDILHPTERPSPPT